MSALRFGGAGPPLPPYCLASAPLDVRGPLERLTLLRFLSFLGRWRRGRVPPARQRARSRQEGALPDGLSRREGGEEGCAVGSSHGRFAQLPLDPHSGVARAGRLGRVLARAVLLPGKPGAYVHVAVGVRVHALAVAHAIAPRALVHGAIREHLSPVPVLEAPAPATDVGGALARVQSTLPLTFAARHIPGVHLPFGQQADAVTGARRGLSVKCRFAVLVLRLRPAASVAPNSHDTAHGEGVRRVGRRHFFFAGAGAEELLDGLGLPALDVGDIGLLRLRVVLGRSGVESRLHLLPAGKLHLADAPRRLLADERRRDRLDWCVDAHVQSARCSLHPRGKELLQGGEVAGVDALDDARVLRAGALVTHHRLHLGSGNVLLVGHDAVG
eukprot:scaffold13166_cov114-Isochrysis_galbana.AAC.6